MHPSDGWCSARMAKGLEAWTLPPDLHLWQIGQDFVLGVWRDELRVEYVRRHALIGRR